MIIYHQFIENENLLIQKASGEWSTEYYIKYVDTVFRNKKMTDVKKVFTDFRFINLEKAFKDLDFIISLRENMVNLNYLSVVLVNSPTTTVVTHLYQKETISKGFNQNYCTTMQKALDLLDLDINEIEMENLLKKMEN